MLQNIFIAAAGAAVIAGVLYIGKLKKDIQQAETTNEYLYRQVERDNETIAQMKRELEVANAAVSQRDELVRKTENNMAKVVAQLKESEKDNEELEKYLETSVPPVLLNSLDELRKTASGNTD